MQGGSELVLIIRHVFPYENNGEKEQEMGNPLQKDIQQLLFSEEFCKIFKTLLFVSIQTYTPLILLLNSLHPQTLFI